MYTSQFEGCQMGQSSGVLLKEVSAFRRCPLIEVSLYVLIAYKPFTFICSHNSQCSKWP